MTTAFEYGLLFILGLSVLGGIVGARLFQKIRVPQVVGYITMGLLIGSSGLGLVSAADIEQLHPLNLFALGIIGFLVGGELRLHTFRQYGRQFAAILLGEGLGAFFLVGAASTLLLFYHLQDWPLALAGGVVFGAIASATDPATTTDVIWEYRCRGVVTTSLIAVVALDDALALTLYGIGTTVARILVLGQGGLGSALLGILLELGGAVLTGVVFAWLLDVILRWIQEGDRALAVAISILLLAISFCSALGLDVIIASMTLGFVLINRAPNSTQPLFALMRSFSIPIYVLFFVLVGARLNPGQMPSWMWGLVVLYILGRCLGKVYGTRLGARLSGCEPSVQKHLGLGLFAQGGVAVGLSILAGENLSAVPLEGGLNLGEAVIYTITATTFFIQLVGPSLIKQTLSRAGETGRNVTEEDVIRSWNVRHVLVTSVQSVRENTPLREVMPLFAEHDTTTLPVVDEKNQVIGILSLDDLKSILMEQSSWEWLVVADVVINISGQIHMDMRLQEAMQCMRDLRLDHTPVVMSADSRKLAGMLSTRLIRDRVAMEVLSRRRVPLPAS